MSQLTNLLKFGQDVKAEAGRVTWPKLKDTRQMTIMVFILASLISLFLVGVDLILGQGMKLLFGL